MTTEDQQNELDDPLHVISMVSESQVHQGNYSDMDIFHLEDSTEFTSPEFSSSPLSIQETTDSTLFIPQSDRSVSTPVVYGSLNNYISNMMQEQKRKKAKERRLRRMYILKEKRLNGLISFDSNTIRYESKRRR